MNQAGYRIDMLCIVPPVNLSDALVIILSQAYCSRDKLLVRIYLSSLAMPFLICKMEPTAPLPKVVWTAFRYRSSAAVPGTMQTSIERR